LSGLANPALHSAKLAFQAKTEKEFALSARKILMSPTMVLSASLIELAL
jgi:hypothetical protein